MSFVLEALKKQEAGHDPDAAVVLSRQALERRRSRLWITLFGIAVAVNAGLVIWMFGMPWLQPPAPGQDPALPEVGAAAPKASQPERAPPPAAPPQPAEPAPPAQPPNGRSAAGTGPAPAPRVRQVTLQNLPDDARTRFPGIAFSTHIYAEDAALRAIVANGQRLQEGDRVRGLEIVAITEDGVVLAFENYRVEVPIVTDW